MAKEINLLVGQRKALFIDVLRPLKLGTIIFLIFYCLVSLAILSYFAYLETTGRSINQEIEAKKGQIARLKKVESLAVANKQRLSALASYSLIKKADMPATIGKMKEMAGNEVSLSQIKMEAAGSLRVSAAAGHPLAFVDFYNRLRLEKDFPEVTLPSVSRDDTGNYRFDLLIKL